MNRRSWVLTEGSVKYECSVGDSVKELNFVKSAVHTKDMSRRVASFANFTHDLTYLSVDIVQ